MKEIEEAQTIRKFQKIKPGKGTDYQVVYLARSNQGDETEERIVQPAPNIFQLAARSKILLKIEKTDLHQSEQKGDLQFGHPQSLRT